MATHDQFTIKAVQCYIKCKGNCIEVANMLERKWVRQIRLYLDAVFIECIKNVQNTIRRKKLRWRMDPFTASEFRRLLPRFYKFQNGRLYGSQKRTNLHLLLKVLSSWLDSNVMLTDQQLNEVYEDFVDINMLSDEQNRMKDLKPWTQEEQKMLCCLAIDKIGFTQMSFIMEDRWQVQRSGKFVPSRVQAKVVSIIRNLFANLSKETSKNPQLTTLIKPSLEDTNRLLTLDHPLYYSTKKTILEYHIKGNTHSLQEMQQIITLINAFVQEAKLIDNCHHAQNYSSLSQSELSLQDLQSPLEQSFGQDMSIDLQ